MPRAEELEPASGEGLHRLLHERELDRLACGSASVGDREAQSRTELAPIRRRLELFAKRRPVDFMVGDPAPGVSGAWRAVSPDAGQRVIVTPDGSVTAREETSGEWLAENGL